MIFINYRKADTQPVVDSLAKELKSRFGTGNVFKDDNDLRAGESWPDRLRTEVQNCSLFLSVIGPAWLTQFDEDGLRRIDNEEDWVRQELETALECGKPVIVLLVGEARMPTKRGLPQEGLLQSLPDLQSLPLRPGRDFDNDVDRLITELLLLLEDDPAFSQVLNADSANGVPPSDQLPSNNLPSRNARFTARETELEAIATILSPDGDERIGIDMQIVVAGLGGMGKTALAIEYAWRHLREFPGGAYFLSADTDFLTPKICELAPLLGILDTDEPEIIASMVKRKLETGPASLLILDNFEEEQSNRDEWKHLLPRGNCRRLFTTRSVQMPGVAVVNLQRLSRKDGIELLSKYRSDASESSKEHVVGEIVDWFDGLTVGVTLAGVYAATYPDLDWSAYADSLTEKRLGAVRGTEDVVGALPDYHKRVEAVFDDVLDVLTDAERRALEYAAQLPEDHIPKVWLTQLLEEDTSLTLPEQPGHTSRADPVISTLRRKQLLLTRGDQSEFLSLHRVLRDHLYERLTGNSTELEQLHGSLADLIKKRATVCGETALTEKSLRWELQPLSLTFTELAKRKRYEEALYVLCSLMHPLKVLWAADELKPLVDEAFEIHSASESLDPMLRARTLHQVAWHACTQRDYERAEAIAREVLRIRVDVVGEEDSSYVASLNSLAWINYCRGEYEQAKTQVREAIEIGEALSKAPLADLNSAYAILGRCHRAENKFPEAEVALRKALELRKRVHGNDHPYVAFLIDELGWTLARQNKLEEGEQLLQQSLAIATKCFEEQDYQFINALSSLGNFYVNYGGVNLERTEALYDKVLELSTRVYGEQSRTYQVTCNNLGTVYTAQKNYDKAIGILQKALSLAITIYGEDHNEVGTTCFNLGEAFLGKREYTAAEESLQKAIEIKRQTLGDKTSVIGRALRDLGELYSLQNKFEQAEASLEQAVEIHRSSTDEVHPQLPNSLSALGNLYVKQQRIDEAIQLYIEAADVAKKSYGEEDIAYARQLLRQGEAYYLKQDYGNAEPLLRKVFEGASTSSLERHDPLLLGIAAKLAGCTFKLGNYAESERLCLDYLDRLSDSEWENKLTEIRNTRLFLATIYRQQGKFSQAEQVFEEEIASLCIEEMPDLTLANAHWVYAEVLFALSKYAFAEQQYHEAIILYEKLNGPDTEQIALGHYCLGRCAARQSKYDVAEKYYRRSLRIYSELSGSYQEHLAGIHEIIAELYTEQGKFEEAESLYRQSFDLRESIDNSPPVKRAAALTQLATGYRYQFRYERAEQLYHESLKIYKEETEDCRRPIDDIYYFLAITHHSRGSHQQAIEWMHKSIDLHKEIFHEENLGLADRLSLLGSVQSVLHNFRIADKLQKEALGIASRICGRESIQVAWHHFSVASNYYCWRNYEKAERHYRLALEVFVANDDHAGESNVSVGLAQCLESRGNYADAEPIYRKELDNARIRHGEGTIQFENALHNLANNLSSQGSFLESEALLCQLVRLRRDKLGENDQLTLFAVSALGCLYNRSGRYAEAEEILSEHRQRWKDHLGEENSNYATSLVYLGHNARHQGKYVDAERFYVEALAIQEHLPDDSLVDSALTLRWLGLLYTMWGRPVDAERFLQKALSAYQINFDEDHLDVLAVTNDLAAALAALGQLPRAQQLMERCLDSYRVCVGEDHEWYSASRYDYAKLLLRQGPYDDAAAHLHCAWETDRKIFGEKHPTIALDLCWLAKAQSELGLFSQAEGNIERALEIQRKSYRDQHPYLAESLECHGRILCELGRHSAAESKLRSALEIRQSVLGTDNTHFADSLHCLARWYHDQHQWEEAESHYQKALDVQNRVLGDNHPDYATTLVGLGRLRRDKGDAQSTSQMLRQALQIRLTQLGKDHPHTIDLLRDLENGV